LQCQVKKPRTGDYFGSTASRGPRLVTLRVGPRRSGVAVKVTALVSNALRRRARRREDSDPPSKSNAMSEVRVAEIGVRRCDRSSTAGTKKERLFFFGVGNHNLPTEIVVMSSHTKWLVRKKFATTTAASSMTRRIPQ